MWMSEWDYLSVETDENFAIPDTFFVWSLLSF
jgi:hypothetical protein